MDIIISNSSGQPIYEQIKEQIKAMILNGTLQEGEALPSMRNLARELRISIITTKRAYEDLEREGFIVSYTGKGCFVSAPDRELMREEIRCQIEELFDKACRRAVMAELTYEELEQVLRIIYNENGGK